MLKYFERSGRKDITDVSMGCRCGKSVCSVCGNEAVAEEDFCEHILGYKAGNYRGQPVFEDNRDIEFFEISFVSQGADKQAKILEKVASRKTPTIERQSSDRNSNDFLTKVANEKNKRGSVMQKNLKEQLKNLPWS